MKNFRQHKKEPNIHGHINKEHPERDERDR